MQKLCGLHQQIWHPPVVFSGIRWYHPCPDLKMLQAQPQCQLMMNIIATSTTLHGVLQCRWTSWAGGIYVILCLIFYDRQSLMLCRSRPLHYYSQLSTRWPWTIFPSRLLQSHPNVFFPQVPKLIPNATTRSSPNLWRLYRCSSIC